MSQDLRQILSEVGGKRCRDRETGRIQLADNRLDLPRVLRNQDVAPIVLEALGEAVMSHDPDAIWGVARGGQAFALELGKLIDRPVVRFSKGINGRGWRTLRYRTREDHALAKKSSRLVGIEDVTATFNSLIGNLLLDDLREGTIGIIALWRSGNPEIERNLGGLTCEWLVDNSHAVKPPSDYFL